MEIRKDSWHYKLYSSPYWFLSGKPPERTNLCGYIRTLMLWVPFVWLVMAPMLLVVVALFSVAMWVLFLLLETAVITLFGHYWPMVRHESSYTGGVTLIDSIAPMEYMKPLPVPSPLLVKISGWRLPPVVFIAPIVLVFLAMSSPVVLWISVSLMSLATTGSLTVLLVRKVRKSQNLQPFFTYLKDKKDGICRQVVFTDSEISK